MAKPLHIPKSKATSSLRIICQFCKYEAGTTNICKLSGKNLKACVHAKHHRFRGVAYEPNTLKRRVKVFKTRDIDEAIKQAVLFKDQVKKGKFREAIINTVEQQVEQSKRLSILQAITFYLAHLDGQHGAEHTLKKRSRGHIQDCERSFLLLRSAVLQFPSGFLQGLYGRRF